MFRRTAARARAYATQAASPPPPRAAAPAGEAGLNSSEFFYKPKEAAELLAETGPSRLRSALLAGCAVAAALYIGVNAAPIVGAGSVTHASRLLRAREPFLQRSGCSRLGLLLRGPPAMGDAAVEAGAGEALLELLSSADAGVRLDAATTLTALAASSPAARQSLLDSPLLMELHSLAASASARRGGAAPDAPADALAAVGTLRALELITDMGAK